MAETNSEKQVIAIRGAKGGAGASMTATNLAVFLAQIGKRVLLVDANFDDGGIIAFLGNRQPRFNISDLIYNRVTEIDDAITPTPVTGLYLLSGNRDLLGSHGPSAEQMNALWQKVKQSSADVIIVDLPADFSPFTMQTFIDSDFSVLVTLPLPDSIEATYRFIKATWKQRLLQTELGHSHKAFIDRFTAESGLPTSPRHIIEQLAHIDSDAARQAQTVAAQFHPQIIVNQIKLKEDEHLGAAMVSASARWLGVTPVFLGGMGWDENVWLSLRRSKVLLVDFRRSRVCRDIEIIVRRIMNISRNEIDRPMIIPPPIKDQHHYEVLEVYPGASEEEIRRAYRKIATWFGLEGMAVAGACEEEEREQFQALAQEAHAALLDKSVRSEYDKTHFPDGFVSATPDDAYRRNIAGEVKVTQKSLPSVHLSENDFVDGQFLKKVREKNEVAIIDISNRTKISEKYLRAVEEEQYDQLPAKVFTRGFVMEMARFLKIDPNRAARDFLSKSEGQLQ